MINNNEYEQTECDLKLAKEILEQMGCHGVLGFLKTKREVTTVGHVLACFTNQETAERFMQRYLNIRVLC